METEEEFTKKCSSLIANSFSALCLAIGHKLNLFDYVNAETPRSSQDIANAAGYRERSFILTIVSQVYYFGYCINSGMSENG